MKRAELYNKLITGEIVSHEEIEPFRSTLETLVYNYFGTSEIYIIYVGGYGTHFFIPSTDVTEHIHNEYINSLGDGEEYNEEDYSEFQENTIIGIF